MKRTLKEILFGKWGKGKYYEGLPIIENKLAGEELIYELEKIKSPKVKEYIKGLRLKIKKKEKYDFKKYKTPGLSNLNKSIIFITPIVLILFFGGWLLKSRPDVTVQLRGDDVKAYFEQQGIVTNFSILNILLMIRYFWIENVIERRLQRPQGLITKRR